MVKITGETLADIKKKVKDSVAIGKSGKPIRTFSKTTFDDVAKGLMNDVDYSLNTIKMKEGKAEKIEVKPVKEFRNGFLKKVVQDAGLDKNDAQHFVDTYKITNVDGFYEMVSESIVNFTDSGKKFDFLPHEDFKASLVMNSKDEQVMERRVVTTGDNIKIKTKKHRYLRTKNAGCPQWLKERLK